MKKKSREHYQIILASIGGIGLYLFIKDKTFRKAVIKAWQEFAKAVEESSNKNTSNTAPTVRKSVRNKRKKKKS